MKRHYEIVNLAGACVSQGDNRDSVIEGARSYFCERAENNCEYGEGEAELTLITVDGNGNEMSEEIVLKWDACMPEHGESVWHSGGGGVL